MNLWMSSFVVEYIYSRSYIHNYCAGLCVIQCSTAVMLLMLQITDLEIALFTLYVKLERGNAREMSIFRFLVSKFLHSSCVTHTHLHLDHTQMQFLTWLNPGVSHYSETDSCQNRRYRSVR